MPTSCVVISKVATFIIYNDIILYPLGVDGSHKCVYLAGNSLSLQLICVEQLVLEELEKWKNKLAKDKA